MNITCVICSELLIPSGDIYVTNCGHVFHNHCLLQWIERSKTCPQCRCKTTEKSIHRLYFNFQSSEGIVFDAAALQSKLDDAELKIRLQGKTERELNKNLQVAQEESLTLQVKLKLLQESLESKTAAVGVCKVRIEHLKNELEVSQRAVGEVISLRQRLELLQDVETLVCNSAEQVEEDLQQVNDSERLRTYVSVLKKAVVDSESKKKILREAIRAEKSRTSKAELQIVILNGEVADLRAQLEATEAELERVKSVPVQMSKNRVSPKESQVLPREGVKRKALSSKDNTNSDLKEGQKTQSHSPSLSDPTTSDNIWSNSPFLSLKQSSNSDLHEGIVPPRPRFRPGLSKFSIFRSRRPEEPVPRPPPADEFWDGMGGRCKPDVFPQPRNKTQQTHHVAKRKKSTSPTKPHLPKLMESFLSKN